MLKTDLYSAIKSEDSEALTTNFQGQPVKGHSMTEHINIKRYNSCTDKLSKVILGENYPRAGRNTTLNAVFTVIRLNIEIATTPPRIARLSLNLVKSFITTQAIRCKYSRSKVKVKVIGSEVTLTA